MRRPTIKDVAREAGVTYPTVSRVLSNKPYVAPGTRERVMRAIEHLGYRPSAAARSMVSNRTHTLAMLVPHLSDPNFGVIVAGAEREARRHGYSVLVADFETVTNGNLLAEHRVDGLVLIEPQRFTRWLETMPDLPHVATDDVPMDNFGGARAVGTHLLDLGHRQAVMIGGPASSPHAVARHAGLKQVFPEARWFPGDWTAQSGHHLLHAALEARADQTRPSAIFAANDFVALGVIHAASERGWRAPHDLSVVGFDDSPLSRHFLPPLTTVRQPLEYQGSCAAALLMARLEGRPAPTFPAQTLELIVRQSTGPLNGPVLVGDSTGPP